jgi:hypothetical protein
MAKPRHSLTTAQREPPEEGGVRGDRSPRGCRVGDDEDRYRSGHGPSQLLCHHTSQPLLRVQSAEGVLDVADLRLDLDDKDQARWRPSRKEVDATTIAVVTEADLGPNLPSVLDEEARDLLLESGVPGIDQPIEVGAVPVSSDFQRRAQHPSDSLQRLHRDAAQFAAFYARDQLVRNATAGTEVDLTPFPAQSERANGAGEIGAHAPMLAMGGYCALTPPTG